MEFLKVLLQNRAQQLVVELVIAGLLPSLHYSWPQRLRLHQVQRGGRVRRCGFWLHPSTRFVAGASRCGRVRDVPGLDLSRLTLRRWQHVGGVASRLCLAVSCAVSSRPMVRQWTQYLRQTLVASGVFHSFFALVDSDSEVNSPTLRDGRHQEFTELSGVAWLQWMHVLASVHGGFWRSDSWSGHFFYEPLHPADTCSVLGVTEEYEKFGIYRDEHLVLRGYTSCVSLAGFLDVFHFSYVKGRPRILKFALSYSLASEKCAQSMLQVAVLGTLRAQRSVRLWMHRLRRVPGLLDVSPT